MKLLAGIVLAVAIADVTSTAHAQPAPVAETAPTGFWFGMRFPWDATSLKGAEAIGLGGLGFDAGVRTSAHWYVGATADLEALMHLGPATMDNPAGVNVVARQRLGGELRYYTGARWIGLRYGGETVDNRTTIGRFADLTLGHDSDLGSLALGWYASVGLSFETAQAYAGAPMATTSPAVSGTTATSAPTECDPYLTFGMRLAFR